MRRNGMIPLFYLKKRRRSKKKVTFSESAKILRKRKKIMSPEVSKFPEIFTIP